MNRPTLPGRTSLFTAAGLTLLTAISLGISPAAHSAHSAQAVQRVQVSGFDFATPKAQRALDRRIRTAIDRVCVLPNRELPRSIAVVTGIESCRAAAMRSVRQQLSDMGYRPAVRAAQSL
jgi:UrcA family protein